MSLKFTTSILTGKVHAEVAENSDNNKAFISFYLKLNLIQHYMGTDKFDFIPVKIPTANWNIQTRRVLSYLSV